MRPLVVVGDALLDVDLVGTASRLTPDAPDDSTTDPHGRLTADPDFDLDALLDDDAEGHS